jgi:hypothetical protein
MLEVDYSFGNEYASVILPPRLPWSLVRIFQKTVLFCYRISSFKILDTFPKCNPHGTGSGHLVTGGKKK